MRRAERVGTPTRGLTAAALAEALSGSFARRSRPDEPAAEPPASTPSPLASDPVSSVVSRVQSMVDPGSFQAWRSAVGDGVLAGNARIRGRLVCVWAQDGDHKGGSLGAAGGETILRILQHADRARVPVIGLPYSGGARLQEGVAALTAYAAIFRAQSLARVPQVTLITGPCAGGAAYSPALGELVVMVGPEARMFLTGPKVVKEVMREQVTAEELGGPRLQGANGVAHLAVADHHGAAQLLRELLGYLPDVFGDPVPALLPRPPLPGSPADPLPDTMRQVYDVRDVVARLTDGGRQLELAPRWARNLVTSFGSLAGRPVGFICNQPRHLGGAIDSCACEKGAWFVDLCDRLGLPLIVLVDTPGFLPGSRQERGGIIRRGASLLHAFSRATVPKLTVTLRQAYGGAHIVMNSRDLGADVTLAWPDSLIGVMGGRQAVVVTERHAIAAGADVEVLATAYTETKLTIESAATAGFVDEVVAPTETRDRLVTALELLSGHGPAPMRLGDDAIPSDDDLVPGYEDDAGRFRPLA